MLGCKQNLATVQRTTPDKPETFLVKLTPATPATVGEQHYAAACRGPVRVPDLGTWHVPSSLAWLVRLA